MEKENLESIARIWESRADRDSKISKTENVIDNYLAEKLKEAHRQEMLKAGPEIFIYPDKYEEFVENTKEIRKLLKMVNVN